MARAFRGGDSGKCCVKNGDFGNGSLRYLLTRNINFDKGGWSRSSVARSDSDHMGDSEKGYFGTSGVDVGKGEPGGKAGEADNGEHCVSGKDVMARPQAEQDLEKKIEHDRKWLFEKQSLFQEQLYDSPVNKQTKPIKMQTKLYERLVPTVDELCPWMQELRQARRRAQEQKMNSDKSPDAVIEIPSDEEQLQTPPSKRTCTSRST